MTLTDEEKDKAWEELVASTRPKTRDGLPTPNITASELAKADGISPGKAYKRLEARVNAGEFECERDVWVGGKNVNVYWKKGETDAQTNPA